jgi:hypothetical protein
MDEDKATSRGMNKPVHELMRSCLEGWRKILRAELQWYLSDTAYINYHGERTRVGRGLGCLHYTA